MLLEGLTRVLHNNRELKWFNAIGRINQGNAQNEVNGLRCYNCNDKGHLANACPKPRTRGSAYFKEALLLALKDEAGGTLNNKEQSFMADADSDDDMEDLQANAAVMLMA